MTNDYKSKTYDALREVIGYPSRGTDQTVTLSQDDRTLEFIAKVGGKETRSKDLLEALQPAADENRKRYYP